MNVRPRAFMFLRYTVLALLALTLALPALAALAADELGIFWDTNYTQFETAATAPSVVTGYLVLKDCTSTSGVLGWECKIIQTGSGTFGGWTLEGQSINVGTFPEFQVGIGGDPLPTTANGVLLASFQFFYDQNQPVYFGLTNVYKASVADEMSYIPADDPETLRVMQAFGIPGQAASINGDLPVPLLDPTSLNFGEVAVGSTSQDNIRITNAGGGTLVVDASIAADCPQFSLVDYAGPYYLGRHQSLLLPIAFAPTEVGLITCNLELGALIPNLPLGGIGREPVTSFVVNPESVDFGTLVVGGSRTSTVYIRNTGETDIPLTAVLLDPVPGLTVSVPPEPVMPPGAAWSLDLTFAPESVVSFATALDLGDVLPDVPLTGSSREPVTLWDLNPEHITFVDTDQGVADWRVLQVRNVGDTVIPLDVSIENQDALFSVEPTGQSDLLPGESKYYNIRFMSDLPGEFANNLLMGTVIPPVSIHANVPFGEEPCLVTPPELDFGEITVGETYTLEFSITNQQAAPMDVAPQDYTSSLVVLGDPTVLDFGETATYWARFTPMDEGQYDGIITLGGDYCGDLPWTALAVEPSCLAGPTPIDFGVVAVNQVHTMPLAVKNPYTEPITLTPVSDNPAFTITQTTVPLQPGQVASLEVLFAPSQVGPYTASIDLGDDGCELVEVLGTAAVAECEVSTTTLDFGQVIVGQTALRYVDVVNTGPATIILTPTTTGPAFSVADQGGNLPPGQSRTMTVTFRPTIQGSVQGTLDFGLDSCPSVTLIGEGESPILVGDNLVGIFFDTSPYIDIEFLVTPGIAEPVTCYLVLKDSSDLSGVSAWECAFNIEGNAIDAGWVLEGNAVNVGGPGEFVVGLAQPLPWSPGVLLATGTIISTLGNQESALLQLGPVQQPSLEGEMAWIGGSNNSLILPMDTTTGQPTVAIIATSIATPVEMPAPLASQAGGQVRLSWSLSGETGDGCHVYRRSPDGRDEKLTIQPVAASGNRFEYVDQPFGFPANATLAYSYAKVTDGVEGPRSPETEIRLSGVPAMTTRLLANVPNPFNPSTKVHFEMQKPGRVRVAVYAMDGRLVRTLVDDSLVAGPHHRTWDGRDDGGRQVSSGAYYLRLETGESVDHRKMMLLK